MICLTGDVHQQLQGSMDQREATMSEPECALRYAHIAAQFGLKVTLFVTGKAILNYRSEMRELAQMDNVTLGGHTYSAFQPRMLFRLLRILGRGAIYGPYWYQKWDVQRTIALVNQLTGQTCTIWRTHAFCSDKRTYVVAQAAGIQIMSDEVTGPDILGPHRRIQLLSLPINTLDDHTHIYHGQRTPEHVKRVWNPQKGRGIGAGPELNSYDVTEWAKIIRQQVSQIDAAAGIATQLIHPICMHVADNFATFEQLCSDLSGYQSIWVQEAATVDLSDD